MTRHADHHAPAGLRTRGTVLVVPGRGETPATYDRLGRRLAADAYRVRVTEAPDGSLSRLDARLTEAAEGTAGAEGVVRPLVLVGADSGAVALAALLGRATAPATVRPDAVVLAGLPGRAAAPAGGWADWEDELDVRTSCPTHRGVLTQDPQVRRGALDDPLPEALAAAAREARPAVPTLLLAGDADPLADHAALVRTAAALPRARLSLVRGARHDVLNDLQHRSVAAEIVTFLETLRNELRPLITVESSSW